PAVRGRRRRNADRASARRRHGGGAARAHRRAGRGVAQARQGSGTGGRRPRTGFEQTRRGQPRTPIIQRRGETEMAVSANRLELLQIAEAVAREKSIDKGIVIAAMEDAIQKAARSRYGSETDVRAEINPRTGEIRLQRLLQVAEEIENPATDILLEDARHRNPAA